MKPEMFKAFGKELRPLKRAHKEDSLLQMFADRMILRMRNYLKTDNPERKSIIEKGFMRDMTWLVAWKRKHMTVVSH